MTDELTARTGIAETLPTVFGYIGIGLAFGMIARSNHLSVGLVFLLSAVVYAGSAQFIMVTLIALKSPILSIVLSVFLVNSRMILLSSAVAPYLKKESLFRNIIIGSFLTDESFALSMNKLNATDGALNFDWLNAVNMVAYCTWVISSVCGAVLGHYIVNPMAFGLGFAVVAMFIGLLYLRVISDTILGIRLQLLMIGVTLLLFFVGIIFIPSNILVLFVTLVSCGLGVWIKHEFF